MVSAQGQEGNTVAELGHGLQSLEPILGTFCSAPDWFEDTVTSEVTHLHSQGQPSIKIRTTGLSAYPIRQLHAQQLHELGYLVAGLCFSILYQMDINKNS